MARPLQQLGIAGLEDLFVKSEGGLQVLRDLEYELRHRQVPRARSLLVKVRAAIKAVPTTEISVAAMPHMPESAGHVGGDLFEAKHVPRQEPKSEEVAKVKSPAWAAREIPVISLSDAYKTLKATPGSSWESIELTRRQLVQRASPAVAIDDKRQQLQRDAENINSAYQVIALDRIGSR